MTLDLVLVGLVFFFAFWGALQGAARQVAQTIAGIAAWVVAGPAGNFFAAPAATAIHSSLATGTVFATFASFIVLFVFLRYLLTAILRRIIAGKDPENRSADRVIGFLLGAGKISVLIWLVLCALSFIDDNVVISGKRLPLVPKDSVAFQLAHTHNLFELSQFSGVKDVLRVARLQSDPKKQARLKGDLDFQALQRDPRFTSLLATPELKKALGSDDSRALLQNNQLLQLLQDPTAMRRISRIAELE